MNQSENINELASALSKAQGEMQAAIKDAVNPFYKSKYADLGSVWDAARPVLCKNGLCIMQSTEMVADKIVMVTTLAHTSGQWVKSSLPLNPSKNDSQGIGAAITYLRRYSLSALVGVVCDDDDDGETSVGRGKTQKEERFPERKTLSGSDLSNLNALLANLNPDNQKAFMRMIKEKYSCESLKELPIEVLQTCITSINAKIKLQNEMVLV